MTGTDPAVDAARRAWDAANADGRRTPFEHLPTGNTFVQIQIAAAREMAAPVRELHRPMTDDGGDLDESFCTTCVQEWTPGECLVYQPWPCDTAKLIYTTEELENPNV